MIRYLIVLLGLLILLLPGDSTGQLYSPNHPELEWQTIETAHFYVHFYDATERSARVAAKIGEEIYESVTGLYEVTFDNKVHLILKDTDDYSNGAAYYYDNKIVIWALPLDFELRGSHNWLRDVITHEFTHIVQLNAAMKFSRKIPAIYFQWLNPEREHREDVIYGYPNTLMSYPVAGTVIPPWFAEGTAQYNIGEAPYDYWDSHRDMILRDRVLHNNLLSWDGMNIFGKKGVGNESVYNQGFALVSYIAREYGEKSLFTITDEMRSPFAISFDNAVGRVLGKSGRQIYADWADSLRHFYQTQTTNIRKHTTSATVISGKSTGNFFPRWSPGDSLLAYLSNQGHDYLSQTGLYIYDGSTGQSRKIADNAKSSAAWAPDGKQFVYSHPSIPTKYGSVYDDLYLYDLESEEEKRLTVKKRVKNPDWSPTDSLIVYVSSYDGSQNLYIYDFSSDSSRQVTQFSNGEQIFAPRFSEDGASIVFDMNTRFGRDIYQYTRHSKTLELLLDYDWDVRSPTVNNDTLTFADDRTGIFNIYQQDITSGKEWALTTVPGGAFMPDISQNGVLAFALYRNAGYRLAVADNPTVVDSTYLAYKKNYPGEIPKVHYDDSQYLTVQETDYTSQYSHMFLIPRLMVEYGTIKPGVYFFSNEILDKMGVMGSASINRQKDLDIFLSFNYNELRPTLYADIAFLTRNITEQINFYESEDGTGYVREKADLRFTLMQTNIGMQGKWFRFPWGNLSWNMYGRYEQYSTFIKYLLSREKLEAVLGQDYISKLRYEYYIGRQMHLDVDWEPVKTRTNRLSYINPGTQLKTQFNYSYEWNDFIDDFKISAGLLTEVYEPNNYHKIENTTNAGWRLPFWKKSSVNATAHSGWISRNDVDDFFHFFGGGMPGIKGYPFYSIEGSRLFTGTLQWMLPLATARNWRFVQFNFRDLYLAPYYQFGDAWTGDLDSLQWKTAAGVELRVGGFSFYSYPTALTLDAAYGFDAFKLQNENIRGYGEEWRFYLKLLFEFDT